METLLIDSTTSPHCHIATVQLEATALGSSVALNADAGGGLSLRGSWHNILSIRQLQHNQAPLRQPYSSSIACSGQGTRPKRADSLVGLARIRRRTGVKVQPAPRRQWRFPTATVTRRTSHPLADNRALQEREILAAIWIEELLM